jgi:hypothetical protein
MRKHKRFTIAGDTHGDVIDPVCEKAFFDFVSDFKPQLRIHSGDLFDFRNLRRGASDEEKAGSLKDDWDAGTELFNRYFSDAEEGYFLNGNHDSPRLLRLADSCDGLLSDYAKDGLERIEKMVKRRHVKMLPYDSRLGVLDIGHIRVIHGYACGMGAATKHARVYGNCFYGHTHEMSVAPVENLDGPAEARGIGCLCKIDMGYNSAQTNKLRHQNGWVYGLLFDDGTYQAFQAKRIKDSFHVATNFKSV